MNALRSRAVGKCLVGSLVSAGRQSRDQEWLMAGIAKLYRMDYYKFSTWTLATSDLYILSCNPGLYHCPPYFHPVSFPFVGEPGHLGSGAAGFRPCPQAHGKQVDKEKSRQKRWGETTKPIPYPHKLQTHMSFNMALGAPAVEIHTCCGYSILSLKKLHNHHCALPRMALLRANCPSSLKEERLPDVQGAQRSWPKPQQCLWI